EPLQPVLGRAAIARAGLTLGGRHGFTCRTKSAGGERRASRRRDRRGGGHADGFRLDQLHAPARGGRADRRTWGAAPGTSAESAALEGKRPAEELNPVHAK